MRCASIFVVLFLVSVPLATPVFASLGIDSPTPPEEFRAVYITYWSAATPSRVNSVVELAREGLINSVVIDLKDVTGRVAFDTRVAFAEEIGARRALIRNVDALVARLQAEGLYVIARIVVFTDPKLAAARPEWGVHSRARLESGMIGGPGVATLWRDRRNLAWLDPASAEVWDYNIAIARDAASRGFDEINFDYIRFPTDGDLSDMYFPVWGEAEPRRQTIRSFFRYLRQQMGTSVISADLFGLATVNRDDLGIGQVIEDALPYFDFICPMVYPSHFAPGFIGKANPAEHPYEVVRYSLRTAQRRLEVMDALRKARIRPWLQDFDLGAEYTVEMVRDQIRAARDALGPAYTGFILWNPRNVYSREALAWAAGQLDHVPRPLPAGDDASSVKLEP